MNEALLNLHAQAFYDTVGDKSKIEAAAKVTQDFAIGLINYVASRNADQLDVDTAEELLEFYLTPNKQTKDETKNVEG